MEASATSPGTNNEIHVCKRQLLLKHLRQKENYGEKTLHIGDTINKPFYLFFQLAFYLV